MKEIEQQSMSYNGILVLGAGLSSLGFASVVPDCHIFEAKTYSGGHAHSHQLGDVWFDRGAHICHSTNKDWLRLISQNAGDVNQIKGSRVLNYKSGHWFSYPVQNHLNELPETERIAALSDLVKAQIQHRDDKPTNYLEWCQYQYGDYLTEHFYKLYTKKYWHTPMEELATDWLGGRLLPSQVEHIIAGAIASQEERQAVFRVFRYPKTGGFFEFVRAEYQKSTVEYNCKAVSVDLRCKRITFENGREFSYEQLVSSIPLPELVGMIKDVPESIRGAASKLLALQQFCVNLIVNDSISCPAHWFYIYDDDIPVSRVSFPGRLAGSVADGITAIQTEIFLKGGLQIHEEQICEQTINQLTSVLGFSAEDVLREETRRYPFSYVVSTHERASAVEVVLDWLHTQGVYSMGLYGKWKYIWSDVAYQDGADTARQLLLERHGAQE